MKMEQKSDQKIIDSWKNNVDPWVDAIRDGEIESRVLITNNAIVDAILKSKPQTVLDLGCGEGWLVRELENTGVRSSGVDVVPEFIEVARRLGSGRFECVSYENIAVELTQKFNQERFDIVVCNFSLLGKESVENLFKQVHPLLNDAGLFIVQTIHPLHCGDGKYEDAWREGSWTGFSEKFSDPAPWYFRTLETWKALFSNNDFRLNEIIEPINPNTKKPASIIFVGEAV